MSRPEITDPYGLLKLRTGFWLDAVTIAIAGNPALKRGLNKMITKGSQICISHERSHQGHLPRSTIESSGHFHFTVSFQDFLGNEQCNQVELDIHDHIANVLGILRDRPHVNADSPGHNLKEIVGLVKVNTGEHLACPRFANSASSISTRAKLALHSFAIHMLSAFGQALEYGLMRNGSL